MASLFHQASSPSEGLLSPKEGVVGRLGLNLAEGLGASGQPSGHLTKSHVHLQLHDVRWMLTPPSWRPESQPRPAGCRGPLPGLQVHLLGLTWPFLCGERGTQPRQSRVCPVTSSDLNLLPKAQLLRSPPGRGLPRCVHLGFVGRTEKREVER